MMSSAHAVSSVHSSKKSIGLVGLLVLSTLGGIALSPTASASVTGDYEITDSISPLQDAHYSSWDPIDVQVKISNTGFYYNTQTRNIEWFVCEGAQTENDCFNQREDYGTDSVQPIQIGSDTVFTMSNKFSPNGAQGIHTMVYRFMDSDFNTTNDVLIFTFSLETNLVDVIFEPQNIISQLDNLANYAGKPVLNTETDYVMEVQGLVSSCPSCNLEADLGWKIVDQDGTELAIETTTYDDLPNLGTSAFTRQLPPLNFDQEGTYSLFFGILGSTSSDSGDLNDFNDLQQINVTFDDTVDLQVTSMYPRFAPSSSDYYYGSESVAVEISNLGNHSVQNPLVRFYVLDLEGEEDSTEDCRPTLIHPGDADICTFDLTHLGEKTLRVSISEAMNEGMDAKPSDNSLSVQTDVMIANINPIIDQSNFFGVYNTADNITFNARISAVAAAPLNFSWWFSGIVSLGYGQELQVPASAIGLGDHYISVRVRDSLNNVETSTTLITVFNSSVVSDGDWLSGYAVTRTHATSVVEYDYPIQGINYGPGTGLEALIRMSIDVIPTTEEPTAGMEWMDLDINLSGIIPDNIPRDSISVRQLVDYDQADWDPLEGDNYFQILDNDTLRVHINENMDLLITGELPAPEINISNPEITLLPDGKMRLDWTATGDLSNPYFGGWQIYRVTSPITASTYFPDPKQVQSEFVWNGLMQDSLSAVLEGDETSWVDNRKLPTGLCASYALIPTDRTGIPDFMSGTVTSPDGLPGLTCGDSIDPIAEVSGFKSETIYTNSTDCYNIYFDWNKCYEVTISWTWPDHEPDGNLTWNLYRIEQKPADIDLRYIQPIVSGLANVPGEKATYTQTGLQQDGISPYRTYYYILTPLDEVGNEMTMVSYPSQNVERVYIEDVFWSYNQDKIPEPPEPEEPPYGVEWLGDLQDYMGIENFQIAGIVMLLTVIINFIGLPIILKKRKRMQRMIARSRNNQPGDLDDDFQDFFN